jgi:hypothetical protein
MTTTNRRTLKIKARKQSKVASIVEIALVENEQNETWEVWVKRSNYSAGRQVETWCWAKKGLTQAAASKNFNNRR